MNTFTLDVEFTKSMNVWNTFINKNGLILNREFISTTSIIFGLLRNNKNERGLKEFKTAFFEAPNSEAISRLFGSNLFNNNELNLIETYYNTFKSLYP